MEAILVAFTSVYIGAFGPRLLWRGALMMIAVMIVAGTASTLIDYQAAAASGLDYRVTITSVAAGLAGPAVFASIFYGLAASARWCHRSLTHGRSASMPPADM